MDKIIKSKEDLYELLKRNNKIFSSTMLDYFTSLIELECSVVQEKLNNYELQCLKMLEIYKEIARYNIYNRTVNLFQKENVVDIKQDFYNDCFVSIALKESAIQLFQFYDPTNYPDLSDSLLMKMRNENMGVDIGIVELFRLVDSRLFKEKEISNLKGVINSLPYSHYANNIHNRDFQYAYANTVNRYENKIHELETKKDLTDEEKRAIALSEYFCSLFLRDCGLNVTDFEALDSVYENFCKSNNYIDLNHFHKISSSINKTLVKTRPDFVVKMQVIGL